MDRLANLTSDQYRKLEAKELFRVLAAKSLAGAQGGSPLDYYQQRWSASPTAPIVLRAFEWETKAAIAPGTTTDAAWAKPLVTSQLSDGYLKLVQQASVLGQMSVTPAPFQVALPYQTSGAASLKWVGENSPKPVSKYGYGTATLTQTKGAGIIVLSTELMKFAAPGADAYVQQSLINDLTAFVDTTLFRPRGHARDFPPASWPALP